MKPEINILNKYILKKFDSTYALWFQNSKSFLVLEEPAFEVFNNLVNGVEIKEIINICQNKFGHLEENIPQFVDEIIQYIQHFDDLKNYEELSQKSLISDSNNFQSIHSSNVYKLGNEFIEVSYANEDIKLAIHPLIAHLASSQTTKTKHKIECLEQNDILIAKYNDQIINAFHKDKVEYFTGGIRQLMYSILFNRDYYDWMTMLHASGITSDNQAILFSAEAGSGKTTISALLKANGFGFLSDDFIAADKAGKAYPFPAAISVKKGSFHTLAEYYPELENTNSEITFIGKSVKYIPVYNLNDDKNDGVPVKAFVFVQYSKNEKYSFEKVDKRTALQLLLKETWVNPAPEFVERFFDWVENTNFYSLRYSETEQALKTVRKIFNE